MTWGEEWRSRTSVETGEAFWIEGRRGGVKYIEVLLKRIHKSQLSRLG
jgi:hypothetical protein